MAAPLRVREQVLGVLAVTATEAGRFDQGDVDLLTAVASHVALAIDRAAELPDHRGPLPEPRGQGAGPHRAAPGRQRGAADRLPRPPGHAAAAHPAREDGLGRPARGRRGPRAQQSHRVHLLQRGHARRLRPAPAGHARDLPGGRAARGGPGPDRRAPAGAPGRLRAPVPRLDDLRHPRGRRPDPQDRRRPAGLHPHPGRRVAGGRPARGARVEPDPPEPPAEGSGHGDPQVRRARPGRVRPVADRPGLPERARQRGPGDPGARHDHDRDAAGRARWR